MIDHTIDILIVAQVDAAELTGLLPEAGLLGTWKEHETIHVYWDPAHWSAQTHTSILSALETLGMSHSEHLVSIHTLPMQDWNATWSSKVKPIRIGNRVRIRPSWEPASTAPQDIDLIIDPKQAFGTGHHATTQLLTEWLEEVIEGGETILDIGTGTGILAMAALRLGARKALGFDCDALAIECARDNGFLNGFREELEFSVMTLDHCPPYPWDLIVANIDRRTLIQLAGKLSPFIAKSGYLLVSGILVDDQEEVTEVFAQYGWMVLAGRVQGEWQALQLTQPNQS